MLLGERLPERIRETVMDGLGLVVVVVGIGEATQIFKSPLTTLVHGTAAGAVPVLIVLGSLLIGGIAGELIGIERGLTAAGDAIKRRVSSREARFTEGFVVASLVFCVGPLTILGSIRGGLLILAIGFRLLRLREIRVANLLPALALAPIAVLVIERAR